MSGKSSREPSARAGVAEPLAHATAAPAAAVGAGVRALAGLRARLTRRELFAPHHLALAAIVAGAAVLDVNRLSQNGYANIFYAAGVKSMLRSLHNFFFVSFDPAGLVSIDKPPLGLWLQAASAKVFGFTPLALLLPQALAAVIAVALMYRILARRSGPLAALVAALALAVFPSFVAVSRENGVDTLMILLMMLAADAALRAIESGRLRSLCWSAVLVGLAFNTKALAAYLVVPGLALAYAVCAPAAPARRALALLGAGLVLVAVSLAWIAAVELTPASSRPYVGGSTDNTELGLTLEYNGFGRVGGQTGGPGRIPAGAGALASAHARAPAAQPKTRVRVAPPAPAAGGAPPAAVHHSGRAAKPVAFGGSPGPLRLFGKGLGDQGAWLVPFALVGVLAYALLIAREGAPEGVARRRDRRLAALLVMGGWFLCEAVVLSVSKGIVHPYYISALAPGCAAMVGVGAVALARLAARARTHWRALLAPAALISAALVATAAAQVVLMRREHYMVWFEPILVAGAMLLAFAIVAARRYALAGVAAAVGLLLIVPTGYAASTWLAPVEGTFPAAGPTQTAGVGGVGVVGADLERVRTLIAYVRTHRAGTRWAIFTDASVTAAPFWLLGLPSGSLAGYSGTDPVVDGRGLARLVARGQARYVLLGGEFSTRGGNRATAAVLVACERLHPSVWGGRPAYLHGLVLFDCAGHEAALARE
ncbi:MAG TPA: glycosyltransferase family 39 protein [Solirubrobacteraceae bacterium]|nr:glycosyltransferase family 39 protein [Solirubrobacteraceae bacterium]